MQRAIDETLAYVAQRKVFGEPLLAMQNTRFKLAECADRRRRSRRPSSTRCIERQLDGTLDVPTAAMAKWSTTDKLCRVVDECLQLHGGYGYMTEYPIARHVCRRAGAAHPRRRERGDEGADRARRWRPRMTTHWPHRCAAIVLPPEQPVALPVASARRIPHKPAVRVLRQTRCRMPSWCARPRRSPAGCSARAGVRHGDRVLLLCQNCPQFVVATYAVLRADAVVVPVNAMWTADEVGMSSTTAARASRSSRASSRPRAASLSAARCATRS